MSVLAIILTLVLVGLGLWLINTYIPMDPKVKNILNVVVVIMLILWLAKLIGLFAIFA